ncbi:hypothetical protein HY837_05275 [archaeon]|nr:hypothetical protein [archaeon]
METTLEQRIEGRKQQARDKNINGKAWTVAKYLGRKGVYEDSKFRITQYGADSYGSARKNTGTKILYESNYKLVFDEHDDEIYSFAPGNWEGELTKLYNTALGKLEKRMGTNAKRRATIKRKKENEIKQRWGLR